MAAGSEHQVELVRAVFDDAALLALLSKLAFDYDVHYGAPGPGGPPGYDSKGWQLDAMRWGEYYRVVCDGETVGGLILILKRLGHYEVGRAFIAPAYQNRGIGAQAFVLMEARYPGVTRWTLGTPQWNKRNHHFYEKVGYTLVRVEDGSHFYEKIIPPSGG